MRLKEDIYSVPVAVMLGADTGSRDVHVNNNIHNYHLVSQLRAYYYAKLLTSIIIPIKLVSS